MRQWCNDGNSLCILEWLGSGRYNQSSESFRWLIQYIPVVLSGRPGPERRDNSRTPGHSNKLTPRSAKNPVLPNINYAASKVGLNQKAALLRRELHTINWHSRSTINKSTEGPSPIVSTTPSRLDIFLGHYLFPQRNEGALPFLIKISLTAHYRL
ncbi:hypothetical protein CDAR_487501 [Caerostris darwini]|uniref:Uncharacterized protein n=1 Tax=Caerostris darwini TaxID=1538125 RepID=A0AAV4PRQ9_9ARAC|nr:hypothetical protein CDAR_487501 [Caerostris darwini]